MWLHQTKNDTSEEMSFLNNLCSENLSLQLLLEQY
jgi:hypothetical protein